MADEETKRTASIVEYRFSHEMRLSYEKSGPKLVGYAAVFNQVTELWKGFREKVSPGAFSESIISDDIRALFNHDPSALIGRNKSGTLRLWEDDRGLGYEVDIPDTDDGKKIITLIKRGDLSQSSFGFNIIKKSIQIDETKDMMTRTIEKAQLFDVSPVTFPAYPQTEGLSVRMKRLDNEWQYLVGDRVIEAVPIRREATMPTSDEEFFKGIDDFLKTTDP